MNIDEALKFLAFMGYPVSKKSLYKFTSTDRIPFSKSGKTLQFKKTELRKWVDNMKGMNGSIKREDISIPIKKNNP